MKFLVPTNFSLLFLILVLVCVRFSIISVPLSYINVVIVVICCVIACEILINL